MSASIEVLPPELEREIFEITAIQDPRSIPALLRVCRRVHTWVEPLLYRILIIFEWNSRLASALTSKPAAFLKAAVRHAYLHLDGSQKAVKVAEILSKCSGIINLVLGGDWDSEILDSLHSMRPQKLDIATSLHNASIWGILTFKHPFFLSVTHLSLFYQPRGSMQEQWCDWASLAALPALTHLSLSKNLARDILREALAECHNIVVVIAIIWGHYPHGRASAIEFAQGLTVSDLRIAVVLIPHYSKDWEIGARGGPDYWVRAEAFVARKLEQGGTEPINYFLDESKAYV
ncbi:hypothetical protein C8R47DRAFT_1203298 [Mycena vitilis]|nr:hypothetical protein C8R47DRAFT_1203298 [Mycena vitilis]